MVQNATIVLYASHNAGGPFESDESKKWESLLNGLRRNMRGGKSSSGDYTLSLFYIWHSLQNPVRINRTNKTSEKED